MALTGVATRLLGSLLFEIDALDPLTFLGIRLVLGVAALLAAYVPARHAGRADPVAALCVRLVRMLALQVSSVRILLRTRRLTCWRAVF